MMETLAGRVVSWASILQPEAIDQAIATSQLPFIFPHVALMPDAHWGKAPLLGVSSQLVGR